MATKQHGGKRPALIRAPPPVCSGSKRIRSRRDRGLKAWKAQAPKPLRGLLLESPKPVRLFPLSVQMMKRTQLLRQRPDDLVPAYCC